MSLLKARNIEDVKDTYESLQRTFLEILDTTTGKATSEDLVALIGVYVRMSVKYLQTVAYELTEPKDVATTMKFMNSFIAEVAHEANIKYYHKEEGYTLIDKPIQKFLDDGDVTSGFIYECVKEIQDSYIEEEIEGE